MAARGMPFKQLEAITRVTPTLQLNRRVPRLADAYWLRVNNRPFAIEMAATDDAGRIVRFAMMQIFVPGTEAKRTRSLGHIAAAWNSLWKKSDRTAEMDGQVVRMVSGNRPETDLPLYAMEWKAEPVSGSLTAAIKSGRRPFYPFIAQVEETVPGLDAVPDARALGQRVVTCGARYLNDSLGNSGKARAL